MFLQITCSNLNVTSIFHKSQSMQSQLKFESIRASKNQLLSKYQHIIDSQSKIIAKLIAKNEFLIKNISNLLSANYIMSSKLKDLEQKFGNTQKIGQQQQRFEINILFQKIDEQNIKMPLTPRQQLQQSQVIYSAQKANCYQQLDKYINQGYNRDQTPQLYEPQFQLSHYKCRASFNGLLRAFYIGVIQRERGIKRLTEIIFQQYMNDYNQYNENKFVLFNKLPDNQIVGKIVIQFIQKISQMESISEVINKLNNCHLYDEIICQILKNMTYTYCDAYDKYCRTSCLDEESIEECLRGLCNAFELNLKIDNKEYYFYSQKNEYQAEQKSKVCQQISLNPDTHILKDKGIQNYQNKNSLFSFQYHHDNTFRISFKKYIQRSQIMTYSRYHLQNCSNLQLQNQKQQKDLKKEKNKSVESQYSIQMRINNHYLDIPSNLMSKSQNQQQEQSNLWNKTRNVEPLQNVKNLIPNDASSKQKNIYKFNNSNLYRSQLNQDRSQHNILQQSLLIDYYSDPRINDIQNESDFLEEERQGSLF